jgi:hypothetical protein
VLAFFGLHLAGLRDDERQHLAKRLVVVNLNVAFSVERAAACL